MDQVSINNVIVMNDLININENKDKIIIKCPNCNNNQTKLIRVLICDAEDSFWYKCVINKKCPLFQIKNL